jgi:diguanylate cyclase (GGDEF)-like protein
VEFPDSAPYILLFTVKDTREDRYAGLNSGADEYIIKGAPHSEVLDKLNVGRRIRLGFQARAHGAVPSRLPRIVDPLTTAQNVRFTAPKRAKEIQRACRRQEALSVLSCRIENLEEIALRYGHAAADQALRAFADDTRQCLRPARDWLARIGEHRFVLVLPRTRYRSAERLARKLCRRFASVPVITTAGSIRCAAKIDVTAGEPWLDCNPLRDVPDSLSLDHAGDR